MRIRKALRAYERGEATSADVLQCVEWAKVAEHVRKRWTLPGDVEDEDIEQELKLGAWKALVDYQRDRTQGDQSTALARFAMFRAHATARKFVDRARGTPASVTKEELKSGRFFRNMSDLNGSQQLPIGSRGRAASIAASSLIGEEITADAWPAAPPEETTESRDHARHVLARKLANVDAVTASAVLAFVDEGSIDRAARRLFLDARFRRRAKVRSEESAREFVLRAAHLVAAQP